jgi:hypothetical protein
MRTVIAVAVSAAGIAAALSLSACGSTATQSVAAKVVTSPKSTAAATPAASKTQAALTNPGGLPVDGTAMTGHPFKWLNNQTNEFRVTLVSVTAGLDPAVLAYSQETLSGTPKPTSGKQFDVVKFSATNTGTTSQSFDPNTDNVTLNVGGVAYSQGTALTVSGIPLSSDLDLAIDYGQYAQTKGATWMGLGLNPGDSGVIYGVYEIPIGATATSLTVPDHFLLSAVMIIL